MMGATNSTRWWALCRREWLEHRVSLGWVPLALFLVLLLLLLTLFIGIGQSFDELPYSSAAHESSSERQTAQWSGLSIMFTMIATPFAWLYLLTGAMVLLNCIYDERKDRSVLFWKSLPVSDAATVLSKLLTVTVTSAGVTFFCIMLAQLAFMLMARLWLATLDPVAGGPHLEAPDGAWLAGSAVLWVTGFLTQAFWLLPVWGWLLLVSSAAAAAPAVWAVAVPAAVFYFANVVFDWSMPANFVFAHLQLVALPLGEQRLEIAAGLALQLELWTSLSMWLGISIGAVFICAAIFMRGRNNQF